MLLVPACCARACARVRYRHAPILTLLPLRTVPANFKGNSLTIYEHEHPKSAKDQGTYLECRDWCMPVLHVRTRLRSMHSMFGTNSTVPCGCLAYLEDHSSVDLLTTFVIVISLYSNLTIVLGWHWFAWVLEWNS